MATNATITTTLTVDQVKSAKGSFFWVRTKNGSLTVIKAPEPELTTILTKPYISTPIVQKLAKNGVIYVTRDCLKPGTADLYSNVVVIGDNVDSFVMVIGNTNGMLGNDIQLPKLVDEDGATIMMESGDSYVTEVYNEGAYLKEYLGSRFYFTKTAYGWQYDADASEMVSSGFSYFNKTTVYQGSSSQSVTINGNLCVPDRIYTLANAKEGSNTVTVTFNSNPQNYSSASLTIKNRTTAISSATPQLEFQGSLRFMYRSALNKFIIL